MDEKTLALVQKNKLFGNMSESTVRQAGKEAAEYEDKIQKIISSFEKRTYFYMSYIDFK